MHKYQQNDFFFKTSLYLYSQHHRLHRLPSGFIQLHSFNCMYIINGPSLSLGEGTCYLQVTRILLQTPHFNSFSCFQRRKSDSDFLVNRAKPSTSCSIFYFLLSVFLSLYLKEKMELCRRYD